MRLEDINLTEEQKYICLKRNGENIVEHGVLLKEHAMDIYVGGEFYTSVVCTEEWLSELVIGRLLCDGMIKSMDEVESLKISEDHSVADVEIAEVCESTGNSMEEDSDISEMGVKHLLESGEDECEKFWLDEWIFSMADTMAAGMPLHEMTWSAHSCYLFRQGELLFSCEDISRHNAVDKVIGYAVKNKIDLSQCAVYSSGRVPVDMMDKIIVSGIPILVSKGMPTLQAVELAKEAGVTLICGARRDQMRVYVDYR